MNDTQTPHSTLLIKIMTLFLAAFAFLLIFNAIALRFDGAIRTGMSTHGDCWRYIDVANDWAHNNYTWMDRGRYYRPAIHLVHSIAVRLMGWNDYSVKVFNAFFDAGSIFLIAFILWRLTRSRFAALAGALLYATPKEVVHLQVMQELPHGPSTFFVLLAFVCLLIAVETGKCKRYALCALAGLCGGVAANMHPDLALLGPGLALALLAYRLSQGAAAYWFADAAIFTIAFLVPHGIGIAFFGRHEVFTVISNEMTVPETAGYIQTQHNFLWRALEMPPIFYARLFDGQWYWALVFYAAAAIAVYAVIRYRSRYLPGLVIPLIVITYCLLFSLLIGELKPRMGRLMLPFFPLIIITCIYWLHMLFRAKSPYMRGAAVLASALLVFFLQPAVSFADFRPNAFRQWSVSIKEEIEPGKRILILPSVAAMGWSNKWGSRGLSHPVYLGENCLYLAQTGFIPLPYREESLEAVCALHAIDYVLFAAPPYETEKTMEHYPKFAQLADQTTYSEEAELSMIESFLKASGASLAMEKAGGRLYQMPAPKMTAADALKLLSEQTYDLNQLPKEKWPIKNAVLAQGEAGAAVTLRSGGEIYLSWAGPAINPAKTTGIWVQCRLEKNTPVGAETCPIPEKSIIALWARKDDIKPGAFPFSMARHVPFTPWAGVLLARPASSATYPGAPIDQFAIRVRLPESNEPDTTRTLHIQSLGTINQ